MLENAHHPWQDFQEKPSKLEPRAFGQLYNGDSDSDELSEFPYQHNKPKT